MSDSGPKPQPNPVLKRSDGPPKPPTLTTLDLMNEGEFPPEELEKLCRLYWTPVYAYIRRRGHDRSEAEDLMRSFIATFLRRPLSRLGESKGSFRLLMLVCLKNFLSNEWERSPAEQWGGGWPSVSLDEMEAEERYCAAAPDLSPDAIYDNRWAVAVLGHAMAQVERDEGQAGRDAVFRRLQVFLTEPRADESCRAAAMDLGISHEAAARAVSRLRRRFRGALNSQIAATVQSEKMEEELCRLKAALSGG